MSTDPDADLPELPAGHDSVLGERERVAAALFGRDAQLSTIGRYRVQDVLGRGAMGVVYEAWDDQLQRTVAVKLIARELEVGGAELRFRREALALGKLAHPNVVTVHEVGTHGGRLFIAMELVRGETLDTWIGAAERSWQDCLGVFAQAGRGLDAAHRAGLVHRDFKPANCIVGESGRVRVLDFGLARGSADLLDEDVAATAPAVSSLDVSVTRTGATVGTPAYMAPEQLRGGEVSAASDQFAFCVALYEALEGVRPFPGRSIPEIYENIEAGDMACGRGRAPTEVVRIVERGLASSPTERWPNLGELVDELDALPHRRARRRTVWSLAGVGVLAAAVAGARWIPRDPCEDLPTTDVWSESRRATLKEALGDGAVWSTLDDAVGSWAHAWDGAQASACTAARIESTTNEVTLARQRVCLLQRERTTLALLGELSQAARAGDHATDLILQLPSLQRCEEGSILAVQPPPRGLQAEVGAVRARIDESTAALIVGDYERARGVAEVAFANANEIPYAPVRAEAGVRLGTLLRERAADRGESVLVRAFVDAEAAADDVTAAEAAIGLLETSTYAERPEAGLRWHAVAGAKLDRIGAGSKKRADLAASLVDLSLLMGDFGSASGASQKALELYAEAEGTDSLRYAYGLSARARVLDETGSGPGVEEAYAQALAAFEAQVGTDHILYANTLVNRGSSRLEDGDHAGARRDFDAALPIMERAAIPRLLATLLVARAQLESMTGGLRLDALDRIQTHLHAFAEDDRSRLEMERVVASFYLRLGETARARQQFEHIVAVMRAAPETPAVQLAMDVNNVGECLLEEERWADARESFEDAQRSLERLLEPDDLRLAYVLTGLGRALVGEGELAQARALLERSLAIVEAQPGDIHLLAQTRLALSKTLGASARAVVLEELAREGQPGFGDDREAP